MTFRIKQMKEADISGAIQLWKQTEGVGLDNDSDTPQKIAAYLNDRNWKKDLNRRKLRQKDFVQFLAEKFESNMKEIGYFSPNRDKIQIPIKNVPLYYLEFYSKHEKGHDLYKKVQYYADDQISLEL